MTIRDYIESKPKMKVSQWVEEIWKDRYQDFESEIIRAAEAMDRITIDHEANFLPNL